MSWRWVRALVVVVVVAVLQALLAVASPATGWSPGFLGLVLLSLVVAVVGLWLVAVDVVPRGGAAAPRLARGLGWTAVLVVVLVAVGVVLPVALPLVVVPVAWVLAAVANGERYAVRAAFVSVSRAPVSFVVGAVVTVLVAALAWFAGAALGLFLPELVGYAAIWVWFGLTAMLVLRLAGRAWQAAEPSAAAAD